MNLHDKSVLFSFLTTLLFTLITPIFAPTLKLHFFFPFLIILFYKKPLITCLWWSVICGILLDMLSPFSRIGIHAMIYTLTSFILYRQRRNFFADHLTTLPFMTFLFSSLSSLIQVLLLNMFEEFEIFNTESILTNLLILPITDAIYAMGVFILPYYLFGKPIRKGEDYFLDRKESRTPSGVLNN